MNLALIVSTNSAHIDLFKKTFEPGLQFISADNCKQAEEQIERANLLLDLIILDLSVPFKSVTGFNEINPFLNKFQIPWIAVVNDLPDRAQTFLSGARDCLVLPLVSSEMIAKVNTILRMRELITRSSKLETESNRLFQYAIQNERLRAIGRLTASLAHGIQNPMQAIQGAIELAMEDLQNTQEVEEYLQISQKEAARIGKLVSQIRQIYLPRTTQATRVNITTLLDCILELIREEILGNDIEIEVDLPADLPQIYVVENLVFLALLNFAIYLTDSIGSMGGGTLSISSRKSPGDVILILAIDPTTKLSTKSVSQSEQEDDQAWIEKNGLSLAIEMLSASQGKFQRLQLDSQTGFKITLPV